MDIEERLSNTQFEVIEFPKSRLATIDLGHLTSFKHYMFALLEVDVTEARRKARLIRQGGDGPSFTAWMIKAIGICAERNRLANAALHGKRRLVVFRRRHRDACRKAS